MINTNPVGNEKIVEKLTERKVDSYYNSNSSDNFALEGEIVVTITLSEYRTLIKEVATKKYDIDKANNDKYERESKIKSLESENAELKQKLFAYIETYGKIEGEETND